MKNETAKRNTARRGEVLVAVMNNPDDFALARDRHWYRVPVRSVDRWLKKRWPPEWLAFYQTKIFGSDAFAINYYSQVVGLRTVTRRELVPEESDEERAARRYYQLFLGPLQRLPKPIMSRRWRLIVFIPTTWRKFMSAIEINDLYDESPLEDRLWAEFKRLQIAAERQEFVETKGRLYALDFAIHCTEGKLDVETDGDTWHADRARIPLDNRRDNDLETGGWKVLRFNSYQVSEQMAEYCLPTIVENIKKTGGVEEGRLIPREINLDRPGTYQLSLFDD
jgi:very-short-patch-repair endonuclease